VQVTCNGYIATTGLATIDWRLTDDLHDPVGQTEKYHTERLWRLPGGNWCYRPDDDAPEVNELPALANGYITFGCLNKAAKLTPEMMRLWAEILDAVPKSRLLLLAETAGDSPNHGLFESLGRCGVPAERVRLLPRTDHAGHMRRFHRIDIALDTFPFNGITTTCDALWMGVPVVSLVGRTHVSRAGASLLYRLDLDDCAANTTERYRQIAIELAGDLPKLAMLRKSLRPRMAASNLTDGRRLAREIEAGYREMARGMGHPAHLTNHRPRV
jgi:predicted O-linked N-acetylglucosamine transferase (SPINDLY family)